MKWFRVLVGPLLCAATVSVARAPHAAPTARDNAQSAPSGPSLLVPPQPDSFRVESEPVPLVIPGRLNAVDTMGSLKGRARLYLGLARDMEKLGELTTALVAYRNAYLMDSSLAGVAYKIGHLYLELGEPDRAVRAFIAEVTRHPGDADAARELGIALVQVGRAADAVRQLELLTRKRPRDDEAWSALGFAYLMAGRAADAERALRRALSLGPARASEHRDLGAALAALGREREARAEFGRAMAMDPNDAGAWFNLGNLERRARHDEAALAAYRAAEARDSSLALAIQAQAQLCIALGRTREADAAFRRWLKASPEDANARLEAVQFFVNEGRPDVALQIAREAVRLAPRTGDVHLMHGVALDAAGDKRGALAAFRRAAALFADAAGRERARRLISVLRAGAPDSLRALFERDSLEHERGSR